MKNTDEMTADGALMAHLERFGFIPWGLCSLEDEDIVKAVEAALETGVPCRDAPLPKGCVA